MANSVRKLIKLWNLKANWWTFVIFVLHTACLPASTLLSGRILSAITSNSNINELVIYLAAVWVFSTIINYVSSYVTAYTGDQIISGLRIKMAKELLQKNSIYYEKSTTGSISSTILGDTAAIQAAFTSLFPELIKNILLTAFSLVVVALSNYYFFLLALGEAILVLLLTLLFVRQTRSLTYTKQSAIKRFASVQHELVTNWKVIRVCGLEKFFIKRLKAALDCKTAADKSYAHKQGLQQAAVVFICGCVIVGVSYWMQSLLENNEIKIGDVVVVWSSNFTILASIRTVGSRIGEVVNMAAIVADMNRVMQFAELHFINNGLEIPDNAPWIIELKDVAFRYPTSTQNTISGLNMKFDANCMTAIVGPSGSGKSTTVSLILKFYEPSMGTILLNNKNLNDISLESFYANIGFVSQEVAIFDGSLEDNIKYGRVQSSLQEVEEACKLANIHSFIAMLPEGYKTMVGERGVKLSGGQRQRIAIARALIRKPKLLLLDEATSALDSESEKKIQEAIENVSKSVTTIVIAHRLSTIKLAKTIYVFSKEGIVIEQGTYNDLLSQNGVFAAMVDNQNLKEIYETSRSRSQTL